MDVGVTNTLGLSVTLPFLASRYVGAPFYFVEGNLTFPGPLDDGTYHAAFQDLRVEARRMFLAGPVAVTPFVGVAFPTHDYETVGEAIPGRHRRELQAGISAGLPLDAIVPGMQVHGRYAYATLERLNGLPHTRSNVDLEVGQGLTARLGIHGAIGWQIAHAGPTIAELVPDWVNHDRFINSSFLSLGVGASFSITRSTEVYAAWAGAVRGRRGAHVARVLAVGVSRSFGGGFQGIGR
jgi:hypothetical protein